MKYGITLLISVLFSTLAFAQAPANDECSSAIDLGVPPICNTGDIYTNVDATASDIGDFNVPSCFANGITPRDVWFTFTPSADIENYRITITGVAANGQPALTNPQVTVYRGQCVENGLAELLCASADEGANEVRVDAFQLTLGVTYYLRINDYSATGTPNAGAFNVCIEERPPINLVNEGGSQECSGTLYDTGGPDGNYGDDEDHVYVICPNQPSNCINLGFTFYNIEYDGAFPQNSPDQILVFDGDNTDAPILAHIGGGDFVEQGVADGGATCFETSASSGCITVQFISDGSVNLEGFEATWSCSNIPCPEINPITVDLDVTPEEMADAIRAAQTTLTVTDLNCPDGGFGIFEADNSDLGLTRGIILSSGDADYAIGPNLSEGDDSQGSGGPGDANLDTLSLQGDGALSEDACILELEVFANTDELIFEYIFGSEEYPEFVNDAFNDIFAFFISGPGIVGDPALDNQRNIAILPNAEQTVVEINSVNNDTNFEYFRNNQIGQSVEYDGLTSGFLGRKKSLTARADVIPCNTYTLKLAVADRGDNLYDSGVFVSDIRGGAPRAEIDFVSGLDYLVEDCTSISDTLVVTLTNNSDSVVTYDLNVLGTATLDDDYTILGLPDSIEFQPGDNEFVFPITVLSDMVEEGTETIIFNFVIDFGCGSTVVSSLEVLLRDRLEVTINNDADTTIFCAGDGAGLTVQGAQTYLWSPEDIIDDPMGETVFVMPESDTIVQVIGFLENCTDTATIFLQEIDPFIEILNGDTLNFCEGDTIQLLQNNNLENSNLVWVPEFAILDDSPDPLNPLISPLFNVNYVVTSTLEGCSVSDTIFVDVKELVIPEMANDTSICEGYSFQPASAFVPFTPETEYDWTPGIHFADSTDVNSTMIPAPGTQEYTLISTTTNGACADTQSIVITEIPARIEILNGDTLEVCAGYDPIELQANISPMGGSAVDWFPDGGGLTPSTGLNYTVQPPISVRYFATYEVNGCPQIDSVLVKVDSLPANMDIEVDPFKDPYCQGDTFFLRSPIFDVGDFPGITHMWFDAPGLQTGDSLYNGFVIAQDTSLFFRVATNGACVDTNEIQINVVQPPQFTLTPQDTSICPGGSVQYQFTIEEGTSGELEWMPDDGSLSCTDCFDPVATPSAPVEYMISLVADGSDCSFPLTATIGFRNQPNVVLPTNPVICPNDQLVLLLNGRQAGVEYRLTGGGLDTDDPLTPVSPLTNTTYTITASNECGMVEETVTVTVIQPQNVQIQGPTEACEGDLLTFTAPTTVPTGTTEQYSWFVNGNFVDNEPTLTVEAVLNMNVRLTYTNRCETVLATATVDITPLPTLTVTNVRRICRGDNLSLASVVNAATTSYQWSGTDGFSSMLPNPNVSPTETTTYTVIATSGPLCDATEESFTVEVVQPFTVSAGASQTICAGDATTLTATTDPANLAGSYAWSGPNIEGPIDQATASVRPDATTTYTVSFLDSDGCFTETATVVVNVIPAPTLTVTNQTSICEGETIPLAIDVDPSTTTYQWSGTDGFTSTDPNPSVSPTTTTTYTVIATTDPDCPSVTTSFTIEVNPTYTLNIDPDITICEGETISVTASTDPTGIAGTYQWSGPNIQGPTDGPSIDVAPTSDATYSVTFTDAEGCFPATIASSSVTVLAALPEPNVTITQNGSLVDSIVFGGTEVTLVADNPPAGLTYTYEWDGNGDPSMGTGQSFTFTAPQIDGTVTYLLMITSEPGGCMVDAPVTVSVQEAKFEIPQLITPNRDGVNDGFRVFFNGSLQDFNLIIFNRWGQEVFQTNDPTQAWDGSRNGVAQPMDTYLYKVIFSQNGISSERDGEFQLIR